MRSLRFNYSFPTGFVIPYPLIGPNSLNMFAAFGLSLTQAPTEAELAAYTLMTVPALPYSVTFPVSNNKFLGLLVPAQLGLIDTFGFNGFPVRFVSVPSNDQDSINATGSAVGEPYFVYINGVQYAYNLYVSQFQQNGTNILIKVPFS